MFYPGLVSITFRDRTPEEIASEAAKCDLKFIEWGSDIHARQSCDTQLDEIRATQAANGITCCSYGTYFRLNHTPIEELQEYIRGAKRLGVSTLRLWAGRKKASDCTEDERRSMLSLCKQAAVIAQEHNVVLCLECHRRSYTETAEGALELMRHVNSPHFRMYWQPNPDVSIADNLAYIRLLREYITHVHVFHWEKDQRFPLRDGIEIWKRYLAELNGDHHLLLEFMPDDQFDSLAGEAAALHLLIQQTL